MDLPEILRFLEFNDLFDYLMVVYLVSFLIQLFYYLFFFSRLAFYSQQRLKKEGIPVSVIICAKNERDNLIEHLPYYFEQDHNKFEVIVVNDNSVDDSADVLKALSLQYKNLKIVNVPDTDQFFKSKKFALTLGIKAAQYENLLLTDADCKPCSKDWIHYMSRYESGKGIILGFGAYEKKKGILNRLIRYDTLYTGIQYLSFALAGIPYMGVGRNLAYKSKLFFENKGFASHQHILSGDDDLFINEVATRKNVKVVANEDSHTISKAKDTFKDWFDQKRRHILTGPFYKTEHKILLGTLHLSQYIFLGLFIFLLIKDPFNYFISALFFLRYIVQISIFGFSTKRIKGKDLLIFIPIFELFFMIFNPVLVISNQISNKVRWK